MPKASTKTDRRIEKSKQALSKALVELMIEVGYEAPSVADIAKRANVGRSTFYAHFADKESLLRESLQGLRGYLEQATSATPSGSVHPALGFSLPMLQHVSESRDLFRSVVSRRSAALDLVSQMLSDLIVETLQAQPRPTKHKPSVSTKTGNLITPVVVAQYVTGSFLALCLWWMNEQPKLGPEQVDLVFRTLVEPGLAQLSM